MGASEPDSADTASWLVEDMKPSPGLDEAAARDENGGSPGRPFDAEAPEPASVPTAHDAAAEEPAELEALKQELTAATAELEGRLRHEVVAEVDGRQEEIELVGSVRLTQAMAAISKAEARLRAELEANVREGRDRGARDLGATTAELRAELAEAERRLRAELVNEVRSHSKALERKRDSLTQAIQALGARLDTFEERLRAVSSEVADTTETLSVMARYRRAPAPEEGAARHGVDLNHATFEDLRGVGLSSTQAARVLTHRDATGGFDSVERLHQVPGLPRKLVERVSPLVRV